MQLLILFMIIIFLIILFFLVKNFDIELFKYPLLISIFIVSLLSILSFTLPLFSFIFAISISSFLMFMSLPFTFVGNFQRRLLSRWYFFQKTFLEKTFPIEIQLLIFLFLFIGIAVSYFRFLLNFSQFVIPLAIKEMPFLLSKSVLYVFGEDDNENNQNKTSLPSKASNDVPQKRFWLFNIIYSRNNYRQYYNSAHSSNFKYFGFCVGFCAMSAAVVTTFYSKEQTEYSKQQAGYFKQQAYDTRRKADAAATKAGLITREEYWRRHPQDALHKPTKSSE